MTAYYQPSMFEMTQRDSEHESERNITARSNEETPRNVGYGYRSPSTKSHDESKPTSCGDTLRSYTENEKATEASDQPGVLPSDVLAEKDYSIFTVPQKKTIILAGSFIGWFSPVSRNQECSR